MMQVDVVKGRRSVFEDEELTVTGMATPQKSCQFLCLSSELPDDEELTASAEVRVPGGCLLCKSIEVEDEELTVTAVATLQKACGSGMPCYASEVLDDEELTAANIQARYCGLGMCVCKGPF